MNKTGIVAAVGSRSANTKFGVKQTHNITVDGEVYQLGFGKQVTKVGDTVSFDYSNTTYGNEIVKGSLVITSLAPIAAPTPVAAGPFVAETPRRSYGERKFPLDALSPDRPIIRQNSLTQARELFVANMRGPEAVDLDLAVLKIIALARKFEAYSAGDLDVAEVKAEMEKK